MRLRSSPIHLVNPFRPPLLLCCLCCLLAGALAQPVVVTVATQNLQEMQALTRHIDAVASSVSEQGNATRVLLGAIEATMSRVVDSESAYLAKEVQTVPTMTLLEEVAFDPESRVWSFEYRSMVMPEEDLNAYKRILYVSKAGNMNKGDTQNPCLGHAADAAEGAVEGAVEGAAGAVAGAVSAAQCVEDLKAAYYVGPAASATADSLSLPRPWEFGDCVACQISVDLQPTENSVEQRLVITIPHETVRRFLARNETHVSEVWGEQRQYTFGIGMLFAGNNKHLVISDQFAVIENSIEQVALSKLNTYSIAKHVSFWSSVAAGTDLRIVNVEYLLEKGQTLQKIDVSMNEVPVPVSLCESKDAAIKALPDSTCLTKSSLCTPSVYTTGSGTETRTWVSVVFPVPDGLQMPLSVNTLLSTRDTSTNKTMLSTVNFQTHHIPQVACADVQSKTFSPVEYVSVDVYRGLSLTADPLDLKEAVMVQNTSIVSDSEKTYGMAEALLTVVFHPKDAAALAYFEETTNDRIHLDQVYMSHALMQGLLPTEVNNKITSGANGRSDLVLDDALSTNCPISGSGSGGSCVTTHDWTQAGGVERSSAYFVFEVTADDVAARSWLQKNVVGDSALGSGAAPTIYSNARSKVREGEGAHTRIFWILPLYHWPDKSPLGLKDTTIISMAWSVGPAVATPVTRRLLAAPEPEAQPEPRPTPRPPLSPPRPPPKPPISPPKSQKPPPSPPRPTLKPSITPPKPPGPPPRPEPRPGPLDVEQQMPVIGMPPRNIAGLYRIPPVTKPRSLGALVSESLASASNAYAPPRSATASLASNRPRPHGPTFRRRDKARPSERPELL